MNFLVVSAATILLTACSATTQTGRDTTLGKENLNGSAFLSDTQPLLEEGKDGEALHVYRNPKYASAKSFSRFTKVLLEPVKLYAGSESKLIDIPQDQAQEIAQFFYDQLYDEVLHASDTAHVPPFLRHAHAVRRYSAKGAAESHGA